MTRFIELLLLLILAIAAGAAGGYYTATRLQPAQPELPVAVIDVQAFLDEAITSPDGSVVPENVTTGYQQIKKAAKALADRGYVVIDRASVIDAPAEYFVHPVKSEPAKPAPAKADK